MYICKKYGSFNNLGIGNDIILGNETLTVGGYALRPDYLNTLKDLTETIGDYSRFTIALVNDDTYEAVLNSDPSLTDNAYYDLSGRRVVQPTRGLYIVNGKKVVIK